LLFLWADLQTRKFVQERNLCANPNICALKPTKKATAVIISRFQFNSQAIENDFIFIAKKNIETIQICSVKKLKKLKLQFKNNHQNLVVTNSFINSSKSVSFFELHFFSQKKCKFAVDYTIEIFCNTLN